MAACQTAGIEVKMITGDHAATARAIAAEVGLAGQGRGELQVMTGSELSAVADYELPDVADRTAVFARVSPEQKLLLVRALQRGGHVVAMTRRRERRPRPQASRRRGGDGPGWRRPGFRSWLVRVGAGSGV